jgi:hypothetical protein
VYRITERERFFDRLRGAGRGMSRNVKSAFVNEDLYVKYKMSSRIIPSHSKLCGGRGTRTHKPLLATVFKAE